MSGARGAQPFDGQHARIGDGLHTTCERRRRWGKRRARRRLSTAVGARDSASRSCRSTPQEHSRGRVRQGQAAVTGTDGCHRSPPTAVLMENDEVVGLEGGAHGLEVPRLVAALVLASMNWNSGPCMLHRKVYFSPRPEKRQARVSGVRVGGLHGVLCVLQHVPDHLLVCEEVQVKLSGVNAQGL